MSKKLNEKKEIKRIKENITEVEYKKLMSFIRGNEILRENTKQNLLRTFTILFFTGLRLNEVQELKIKDIKNLLQDGNVKIDISKTSTQRKLYLTNSFQKELVKLFDFKNEDDENRIISKGSDKNKRNTSRSSAKSNRSGSTSLSNNAIQNSAGLTKVDKHNYRKYDNNQNDIEIIKGSSSLVDNIKKLYMENFIKIKIIFCIMNIQIILKGSYDRCKSGNKY